MSKKEYKKHLEERKEKYQSVAYEIGARIQELTGQEIRVTVPGPYAAGRRAGSLRPGPFLQDRRPRGGE